MAWFCGVWLSEVQFHQLHVSAWGKFNLLRSWQWLGGHVASAVAWGLLLRIMQVCSRTRSAGSAEKRVPCCVVHWGGVRCGLIDGSRSQRQASACMRWSAAFIGMARAAVL
eukprot:11107864-Alexandrium_andersonii.AAC.1